MSLLDRHIELVEALRRAGLPVSLSEDLDAIRAVSALPGLGRESLRESLAATLVKRQLHRASFDTIFDLYFPALVGDGFTKPTWETDTGKPKETLTSEGLPSQPGKPVDGPEQLGAFRDQLAEALAGAGDLESLARDGVGRFGQMRGRGPGLSSWSAYTALHRIHAAGLVDRVVQGLLDGHEDNESTARRRVQRRLESFTALVEAEARRRIAEEKGPGHMAKHSVRPSIEQLDFTSARKRDLEEMRRQIHPLARRLATRLTREHHARRRGPLDVRRTIRASMQTGGVPLTTRHKPKRPGRTDLVILCDVSGSVANFAQFTLMLCFALREQFTNVRAFTFVDEIHEVTQHFKPGADPVDTMLAMARSAEHATLWGRTNYGRALTRFHEEHREAVTQRSSLLILGDARSNYSDLALPVLRELAYEARHTWWLNPEHPRHWDTGDSAAKEYGEIVSMVECRNLTQLGEFIHDIA